MANRSYMQRTIADTCKEQSQTHAHMIADMRVVDISLVPRPHTPPGEKRSGERSRIPWAYYPKRVMTNEIARSVFIT